jgi:outer membrane protein assembly factor BamB
VGSDDSKLHAVNPHDGSKKWTVTTGGKVRSGVAIEGSPAWRGALYFGSADHKVRAVSRINGHLLWTFDTRGAVYSTPAVNPHDGTVYAASRDTFLYAIDRSNGSEKWRFQTGGSIDSSPTVHRNSSGGYIIIVGSNDDWLRAISAEGTLLWEYQTAGNIVGKPTVHPATGTVYVGAEDSWVYAVRADGSLGWKFRTGGPVRSSPRLLSDGAVVLGSDDSRLYAFDCLTCSSQPGCQTDAATCATALSGWRPCLSVEPGYALVAGVVASCVPIPNALSVTCSDANSSTAHCRSGFYRVPGSAGVSDTCVECSGVANASSVACTALGNSRVIECNAGFFVAVNSPGAGTSDMCNQCSAVPNAAAVRCTGANSSRAVCLPGFFARSVHGSSDMCVACQQGKYQPNVGKTFCVSCTRGHYTASGSGGQQANSAATQCVACLPGKFNAHDGGHVCHPCANGRYTAVGQNPVKSAATICIPCPASKFNPGVDNSCDSCTAGNFTTSITSITDSDGLGVQSGATHCRPCPPGRANPSGDGQCDQIATLMLLPTGNVTATLIAQHIASSLAISVGRIEIVSMVKSETPVTHYIVQLSIDEAMPHSGEILAVTAREALLSVLHSPAVGPNASRIADSAAALSCKAFQCDTRSAMKPEAQWLTSLQTKALCCMPNCNGWLANSGTCPNRLVGVDKTVGAMTIAGNGSACCVVGHENVAAPISGTAPEIVVVIGIPLVLLLSGASGLLMICCRRSKRLVTKVHVRQSAAEADEAARKAAVARSQMEASAARRARFKAQTAAEQHRRKWREAAEKGRKRGRRRGRMHGAGSTGSSTKAGNTNDDFDSESSDSTGWGSDSSDSSTAAAAEQQRRASRQQAEKDELARGRERKRGKETAREAAAAVAAAAAASLERQRRDLERARDAERARQQESVRERERQERKRQAVREAEREQEQQRRKDEVASKWAEEIRRAEELKESLAAVEAGLANGGEACPAHTSDISSVRRQQQQQQEEEQRREAVERSKREASEQRRAAAATKAAHHLAQKQANRVTALRQEQEKAAGAAAEKQALVQALERQLQKTIAGRTFPQVLVKLGVLTAEEGSEASVINRAYRKALIENHPDRCRAKGYTVEQTVEAEEIYKLLQNEQQKWQKMQSKRRRKYRRSKEEV